MEFNRWPVWVKAPRTTAPKEIAVAMPAWRLGEDDFKQGVDWLIKLGYLAEAEREDIKQVRSTVRRFQEAHPQLDNDGVMGRATLDQLQRVIDLKAKSAKGASGSAAGAATGAADHAAAVSGYGDLVLYGSLALLVVGGVYLAWRYRDEVRLALKGSGTLRRGGLA